MTDLHDFAHAAFFLFISLISIFFAAMAQGCAIESVTPMVVFAFYYAVGFFTLIALALAILGSVNIVVGVKKLRKAR